MTERAFFVEDIFFSAFESSFEPRTSFTVIGIPCRDFELDRIRVYHYKPRTFQTGSIIVLKQRVFSGGWRDPYHWWLVEEEEE